MAVPDRLMKLAPVAGPPSPSGPKFPPRPVPAGVVSLSVCSLTFRAVTPSATYRLPPANARPVGAMPTEVALPGPPTPPATVVIVPGAAATARAAGAAATGAAATAAAGPAATAPATTGPAATTARAVTMYTGV